MIKAITHALLITTAAIPSLAFATTTLSEGDVFSVKSNKLIYREQHTFAVLPDKHSMKTRYTSPSGDLIGERTVNFDDGFVSNYTFSQLKPDIIKRAERSGNTISYQASEGDKTVNKSFTANKSSPVIINAGMFEEIQRHWSALINNESIKFELALPARGRTIGMRLKRVKVKDSEMIKHLPARNKVVFSLSISSRLLRWLVDPIELAYDSQSQQLAFYQGPSNLLNSDGTPIGEIRVIYKQPKKIDKAAMTH